MENNIINNGGGLKLESPVEVTLPYTATRDCFICLNIYKSGGYVWLYNLNRNNAEDVRLQFQGYVNLGNYNNIYFPLQKGDTISLKNQSTDSGTLKVKIYVMWKEIIYG